MAEFPLPCLFFAGVHYMLPNTMLLVCSKQKFIFRIHKLRLRCDSDPKKKILPNKCPCFETILNIPIIRTIKANHEFSLQYLLLSDIEVPMSSCRYQTLVSRLRPCPFISMGSSTWDTENKDPNNMRKSLSELYIPWAPQT